jgi:hypothetical protein
VKYKWIKKKKKRKFVNVAKGSVNVIKIVSVVVIKNKNGKTKAAA